MTETKQETITITVDGKEIGCEPGELLIEVAKRAGIYIPYFCYHPRMDPVGACRMCLINLQPGPPKPQTACTTRVADGMVVETQFVNTEVREAQQGVLEFLLINHPLDCPICDRGGECPLQDQTQDYGAAESRFVEMKRRFEKAVPISPLIRLDRERCILCYRCTRFCEELSGDTLIGVMERGSRAYIFPFEGEMFDSYFSGNTVQICPVGALTSSEYRFRARPWDVHNVASTCNLCSCGCSLNVGVRVQDGNVVRFSAAVNEDTNEEWLCDKGRYANAYISSADRLTQPLVRRDGELYAVSWNEAFEKLAEGLGPVVNGDGQAGVIVGGSLCDEDAFVAQKFAREALGTNNIDHRLEPGMSADALVTPGLTYDDVLGADVVALVGCDAREELPILFLRLRIAATKRGLRTVIVHPREVALTEYADVFVQPLPGTEAALEPGDLEKVTKVLSDAKDAVVLLGPRMCTPDIVAAWGSVASSARARFGWLPRRAGEYGALAAGAHPELLPGWKPATDKGLATPGMLRAAADGNLHALWLVGADVIADVPEPGLGQAALEKVPFLVVQDVQWSPLLEHADVVLPGATFVERDGTLTDWEGRRQEVHAAVDPPGAARADYAILAETARRLGKPIGCRTITDVRKELDAVLGNSSGAQVSQSKTETNTNTSSLDGGVRLLTYRLLYDDGSRMRDTAGLRELTAGAFVELNPADAERAGVEDGQNVLVSSAHGSLKVRAQISKGIREGVAFVPWSQWGESAQALVSWDDLNPAITVEPD